MSLDSDNEDVRSGKGREDGGARIELRDSRVSAGLQVFWGCLGVVLVGMAAWTATSINELNLNMARVLTRLDQKDERDLRQDDDLRGLNHDVAELQGKTFRNVDGYQKKEPDRGK